MNGCVKNHETGSLFCEIFIRRDESVLCATKKNMSRLRNVTDFRGIDLEPNVRVKDEPASPPANFSPVLDPDELFSRRFADMKLEQHTPMRPSLSMSDLTNIRADAALNLGIQPRREVLRRYSRKPATPALSTPALSRSKFTSMAEAIYHFQRDTPVRFHTTGSRAEHRPHPVSPIRVALTRPKSPTLRCALRSRPHRVLTAEEREKLELEEIRKYKYKAQPIPKAVVSGGHLPDVVRRTRTVPEPFNLTEMPQRVLQQQSPDFVFTARPVPHKILKKPQVPPKPPSTITQPITPKFLKERARSHETMRFARKPPTPPQPPRRIPHRQKSREDVLDVPHHGVGQLSTRSTQEPLRVEPFSFEKRDEFMRKKKEDKINQIIEEEKKLANQFKAKPIPRVVKKKAEIASSSSSKRSECSSTVSENKENFKFEARPPLVLSQKPFKPVLTQLQITELKPFALSSEKRASEREQYDRYLKEKEEEAKRLAEDREKARKAAEEAERARIRAQLVHHAQPVPDLVCPFVPEKSNAPLTEPQTPLFVRRWKKAQ